MAHSSTLLLLLSLLPISIASPHKLRLSAADLAALEAAAPPPQDAPTTFFEIDRPIRPPPGSAGPCSTLLLSHSFAFTYTKPPVTAAYSPPPCLLAAAGRATSISLAVLEWRATCRGVQYDRIFGVWLGGAELLRSCTAEPRRNGIVWSISKDITKYASLLAAGHSTLAVYLGNLVNANYTGIYHANLTLHLYFRHPSPPQPATTPADLIIPISRSLPLNDGLWFEVQSSTNVESKRLTIPPNSYRAVLEVYVSFHQDDEFWYTNTPDDNGPFREVTVRIDGDIIGAVWPFTVIYTGGINPLLWQPITGIGSFNLPTYDIEITPFLGKILDGKEHVFGFAVTNALDVWFVDANLHLWLDPKSTKTTGGLINYDAPQLATSSVSRSNGSDEQFYTTASRHISATGWVKSSYGKITTTFTQRFNYANTNAFLGNGSAQAINQTIDADYDIYVADHAAVLYSQQVHQNFPLYIYAGVVGNRSSNNSYTSVTNVELGFDETRIAGGRSGFGFSSLSNAQAGLVEVEVRDRTAVGVSWSTHQVYKYEATDGCYLRNVTSRGYSVLFDHSDESCAKSSYVGAGMYKTELVKN